MGAKDVVAGRAGERQLRTPTLDGKVGALLVCGVPMTRAKRQMRDKKDKITTNWLANHRGYKCSEGHVVWEEGRKAGKPGFK
eukprot:1062457-Prorocentrum_minimum.AAC.1